jgi:polysaccharide deacetylase family protein (PEP-CTERM system associated)
VRDERSTPIPLEWPTAADIAATAAPLVLSARDRPANAWDASATPSFSRQPARCALTADVEDWFDGLDLPPGRRIGYESRVVAATDSLLALFAAHRVRATFFVLGRVAERHPALVERILAAGHDVGSHGHEHHFAYRLTPEQFARDLDASLIALRRAGAGYVEDYRAPYFSVTRRSLWALDVLARAGIVRDSSIMPAPNPRYGIARAPVGPHRIATGPGRSIFELPVSCLDVGGLRVPFGGGVYLRAFPLALVRAALHWTLARGRPVVLYVHPWELDPTQPRLDLPRRIAATRYHRLGCTRRKLNALLGGFRWGTLAEVAAAWSGEIAVSSPRLATRRAPA